MLAAVVLLVVAAAVVLVVTDPFSGAGGPSGGVSDNGYATSTQAVVRESISQQTQVSATLGYAGDVTIRLPAGNAPAAVTQAQQTVTTDQGMLSSAQSTLSERLRGAVAGARDARRRPAAGGRGLRGQQRGAGAVGGRRRGRSGASGGCATDAQLVASGQQSVTADAAKVSADQSQVSSAEHSLAAARSALATADAQATVYGQDSTFTSVPSAGEIVRRGQQPVLDRRRAGAAALRADGRDARVRGRDVAGRGRGGAEREPRRARLRARTDG